MTRGRGRTGTRGGRSSIRGDCGTRRNMPTVPNRTINPQRDGSIIRNSIPQRGSTSSEGGPSNAPPVQASGTRGTPNIPSEPSITAPNQSNPTPEGLSTQSNTIGEVESSSSHGRQTILILSPDTGLEPSRMCSEAITASFRHELDPNGINWKNVSRELKDFYYGEFRKAFYWDLSMESAVKKEWEKRAPRRYSDFVSKIKKGGIKPNCVQDDVWASWKRLWADPKNIEKSEIAQRNRCGGGNGVALGTHTGGSITIGEHRKRLVVEKGRDVTPSEVHLHVHTHGHDGKSFVGERSRIVHERFEEIIQQQTQTQSEIDQCQAYYQAAGGEKKRRVYGLGCAAQSYYGPNLRMSSVSNASSAIPPPNDQPTPIGNLEELVTRLIPALTQKMLPALTENMIPALTDHMLPVFVQRVRELISLPSHQTNVVTGSPSTTTPIVDAPTTNGNADDVHSSSSDDDRTLQTRIS